MDGNGNPLEYVVIDTKYDRNESGEEAVGAVLEKAGKRYDEIEMMVSTGYGRRSFERSDYVEPEVICHARGTVALCPGVRTLIDFGGQDSKLISIDEDGLIDKFEMNDKCAAGTGRFFEVLSSRLINVDLDELGPMALKSKNPCVISSLCTVFAESEIVSYLSQGVPVEDIAMGILDSVARRIYSMGSQSRIPFEEQIVVSGGMAKNVGLKRALANKIGKEVHLLPDPQLPAALGAALIARDKALTGEPRKQ